MVCVVKTPAVPVVHGESNAEAAPMCSFASASWARPLFDKIPRQLLDTDGCPAPVSLQEQATIVWSDHLALRLGVELFLQNPVLLRVVTALLLLQSIWEEVSRLCRASPVPKLSTDKLVSAKKVVGHC